MIARDSGQKLVSAKVKYSFQRGHNFMRFWRLFLVVLMCSACAAAQDMDKQARDEASKAFREKKIDAAAYAGFISKVNNGKSEEVLKELGGVSSVSSAPLYSDWPNFLGPGRNGLSPETGVLKEWPEEGPKMLWRVPANKGWGSPCIYKGQVFLSGAGKDGWSVNCYDAFAGKEVWKFNYKPERKVYPAGWGYCPRGTVTATEKYVYNMDEQGILLCLDRKTGAKIWMRDFIAENMPFPCSGDGWKGLCMSPLIEDKVIFQSNSLNIGEERNSPNYLGIDAESGKNIWEVTAPKGNVNKGNITNGAGGADPFQTPAVVMFEKEKCALVVHWNRVFAIRIRDGKIVWTLKNAGGKFHSITPGITDSFLLLSPYWDTMSLFKVDWSDTSKEAYKVWEYKEGRMDCSTPVIYEGYAYALVEEKGKMTGPYFPRCIELATGKVMWEGEKIEMGESLMLADGMLYIRGANELLLVEANPGKYTLKSKFELPQKDKYFGWVMPALAYGRLFVRTDTALLCYQAGKKIPSQSEANIK